MKGLFETSDYLDGEGRCCLSVVGLCGTWRACRRHARGVYPRVLAENPAKLRRSAPALEVQGTLPSTVEMQRAVCSLSSMLDASDCQFFHVQCNANSFQRISRLCVAGADARCG